MTASENSIRGNIFTDQEGQRDLREMCGDARGRAQDDQIAQLAAETKVSILEKRLQEGEQKVRHEWKKIRMHVSTARHTYGGGAKGAATTRHRRTADCMI